MLETPTGESFALVSLKAHNRGTREEKKPMDRDSLWCTFYKKTQAHHRKILEATRETT